MTLGSDGAIWFSQNDSDTQSGVGRIDPFGGYTFYPMFGGAGGIVNGPDGNLWFESNFNICKMNTQGQILGRYPHSDQLYDDSAGPDGAVWFTGFNYLLRVNTNGQMTQFSAPVSGLYGITVLNGSLWMTEGGNALLSFDPVSQTFGSPIQSPENLRRIVAGQDGNFWMTGLNAAITTYVNQILTVMPSSLTLQNGKAGTLTVTETHYDGTWKAQWVGSIVNVVQTSPGVFTVTGVAPGTTKVTIEDTMHNSTRIPVTVQ
jgi:streptogramin lyase